MPISPESHYSRVEQELRCVSIISDERLKGLEFRISGLDIKIAAIFWNEAEVLTVFFSDGRFIRYFSAFTRQKWYCGANFFGDIAITQDGVEVFKKLEIDRYV